jgi:hypothetical protein
MLGLDKLSLKAQTIESFNNSQAFNSLSFEQVLSGPWQKWNIKGE